MLDLTDASVEQIVIVELRRIARMIEINMVAQQMLNDPDYYSSAIIELERQLREYESLDGVSDYE